MMTHRGVIVGLSAALIALAMTVFSAHPGPDEAAFLEAYLNAAFIDQTPPTGAERAAAHRRADAENLVAGHADCDSFTKGAPYAAGVANRAIGMQTGQFGDASDSMRKIAVAELFAAAKHLCPQYQEVAEAVATNF